MSYDAVWSSVIELFAERNWNISNMAKDSGLITTDWMSIDNDTPFADCGGSGITSVHGTQIRFNVLVKALDGNTSVMVNTGFRQLRSFDNVQRMVDCTSKGGVEQLIHSEVASRAAQNARVTTPQPAAPVVVTRFYCTAAPADPTHSACARTAAGCAKRQADLVAAVGDATPCAEQNAAVCFAATTTEGVAIESCHPTLNACSKQHQKSEADPASFSKVTGCVGAE
ncbi:MAG: outer membrane protein assembly factor BamC [Deltaproteobacteria bacterium]|nr:outer membrane protein assembly factor BamC [Deltaproteobacteria bacterium]